MAGVVSIASSLVSSIRTFEQGQLAPVRSVLGFQFTAFRSFEAVNTICDTETLNPKLKKELPVACQVRRDALPTVTSAAWMSGSLKHE